MRKTKRFLVAVILCGYLIILVSCQQAAGDSGDLFSSHQSPMIVSTLQSYATPISVFEYPDQVTDGKLLLSIELADKTCFQRNRPIVLKLIFSNLTNEALTIPSDFSVAVNRRGDGGNLIPFIKTVDGENVLSLADYSLVDMFSTPSNVYSEIPTNQKIEFDVNFLFPQVLVLIESVDAYQLATPTPGQYFIRLVYTEYRRNDDVWHGAIGSNQLEICVN